MDDTKKRTILAEIDHCLGVENRQPGDVSVGDLSQMWGLSGSGVRGRMRKLEEAGTYIRLRVRVEGKANKITVWRKVERVEGGSIDEE